MSRAAIVSSKFNLSHYIAIARIPRWTLNLLIIPGALISALFVGGLPQLLSFNLILGFLALCFAAFANYTINEYLDAEFDALHPEKRNRPGACGLLQLRYVLLEYALLAAAALGVAYAVNDGFFLVILSLLVMGVIYNVAPVRTKDKPYLDILSESVNNPIRFVAGWYLIAGASFPPLTVLLSCWMAGAFLMTLKRYAEYRHINNPELVGRYRASFRYYTEEKLLILALFFMMTASFFLVVFLFQINSLLLVTFPLFAGLFVWYVKIAMLPNSPVQHLENLFKAQPKFVFATLIVATITLLLLFI